MMRALYVLRYVKRHILDEAMSNRILKYFDPVIYSCLVFASIAVNAISFKPQKFRAMIANLYAY